MPSVDGSIRRLCVEHASSSPLLNSCLNAYTSPVVDGIVHAWIFPQNASPLSSNRSCVSTLPLELATPLQNLRNKYRNANPRRMIRLDLEFGFAEVEVAFSGRCTRTLLVTTPQMILLTRLFASPLSAAAVVRASACFEAFVPRSSKCRQPKVRDVCVSRLATLMNCFDPTPHIFGLVDKGVLLLYQRTGPSSSSTTPNGRKLLPDDMLELNGQFAPGTTIVDCQLPAVSVVAIEAKREQDHLAKFAAHARMEFAICRILNARRCLQEQVLFKEVETQLARYKQPHNEMRACFYIALDKMEKDMCIRIRRGSMPTEWEWIT